MQHHAADQLHVEMAHAQHPFTGLAADGKGLRQQGIQSFTPAVALLEFCCFISQLIVRKTADSGFQVVDLLDYGPKPFQLALVFAANKFFNESTKHPLESPGLIL